ncbi:hypothetical protein CGCF415_v011246 [Colletotrichum fructicola]|uniref:Uncharacterized protein n=1 Tax=Colletotrichum fructicola (strain Nara gc5) TaxID=1213859 RepID=A0A7J6IMI9_COLFN|nr:hypothetical protein CGGC5_v014653 [Colletotrichum fructicola Nara gc5]KAF4887251.1 hypothetical protein CGCFRS4_v010589 [Colletotrichum fructicola]KAF4897242.1 hypothetical protein CGCF415_v011246 [Colletotrichum fructicola]KAF4930540.1 hypothetical protein CGCF245_v011609 [Colletotrichum fructicola]KAF5483197.1 hypothetical protein CGCF413_v014663 [Colletotrichum fructicola]
MTEDHSAPQGSCQINNFYDTQPVLCCTAYYAMLLVLDTNPCLFKQSDTKHPRAAARPPRGIPSMVAAKTFNFKHALEMRQAPANIGTPADGTPQKPLSAI